MNALQLRARSLRDDLRAYLVDELLPFWIDRSPDPAGGFLTHFDRDGRPTGATEKTFLMQIRMLYSLSLAEREGYGGPALRALLADAAGFVLDHYSDPEHGGFFWSADRDGSPTDLRKIGYGQAFAIYAFGEYHQATGDPRGRAALEATFDTVLARMADPVHGGYFEIMERDWRPAAGPRSGGDRKSFDVHMHLMEAFTKAVEVTGDAGHRARLADVVAILTDRMLSPVTGTGIQQFTHDFTPLPAIEFDGVAWGRDARPASKPIDITSYGHDVEFAWLLLRAADALHLPHQRYAGVVQRLCDHCADFGIDPEHGGVFIEGPAGGPPTSGKKQFWQQAEVLVGMLAAHELLGGERYFAAYLAVHDFVFRHFVHRAGGGEWFALVDRDGTPRWDYLGDHYKISYHTVRSTIEQIRRLDRISGPSTPEAPPS